MVMSNFNVGNTEMNDGSNNYNVVYDLILGTYFSGSYISLPYDANARAQVGQANSFSFWFRVEPSSRGTILSNLYIGAWDGFLLIISTAGEIQFDIRSGTSNYFQKKTTNSFNDGNLHHAVVTYGGASNGSDIIIYVDNVVQTLIIISAISLVPYAGTDSTNIGRIPSFSNYFGGLLFNLAIYKDVLTPSEVSVLNNGGNPPRGVPTNTNNLVGYWKMGEGDTYPTIIDSFGSSNGVMYNMSSNSFRKIFKYDNFMYSFSSTDLQYDDTTMNTLLKMYDGAGNDIPFTIECEIKLKVNKQHHMVTEQRTNSSVSLWTLIINNTGYLQMYMRDVNSNYLYKIASSNRILASDPVKKIRMEYDGSKLITGISLYIDDVLIPTTNDVLGVYEGLSIPTTTPLDIGTAAGWTNDISFTLGGWIRNFKIWKDGVLVFYTPLQYDDIETTTGLVASTTNNITYEKI